MTPGTKLCERDHDTTVNMQNIVSKLKWVQVGLNVVIVILSLCVMLPIGYVYKYCKSTCLLNATLHVNVSLQGNETIVQPGTCFSEHAENSLCFYTTFMPVTVAIHAFIWTWFFILARKSLTETGDDSHMVIPVVILHAILFICMLVSSGILSWGFAAWCRSIIDIHKGSKKYSCSDVKNFRWYPKNYYVFFQTAEISSWLLTFMVAGQIGVAIYRTYRQWTVEDVGSDKTTSLLKNSEECESESMNQSELMSEHVNASYSSDLSQSGSYDSTKRKTRKEKNEVI